MNPVESGYNGGNVASGLGGAQGVVASGATGATGAPMAGGGAPTMGARPVIGSGAGDIYINNSGRKPRRGLIIGIIAVAVLAAVAVVLGAGAANGWFGRGTVSSVVVATTPREAFNRYANYLLYGTESAADIEGDYVWGYRYYANSLDAQFDLTEEQYAEYMANLASKYGVFYNLAAEEIGEYNDVFWLFYYQMLYPDLTVGDVLDMIDEDGEDAAIAYVREYYAPYLESSNEVVVNYGRYQVLNLLYGAGGEVTFPDTIIEIYQDIWSLMEDFYEE